VCVGSDNNYACLLVLTWLLILQLQKESNIRVKMHRARKAAMTIGTRFYEILNIGLDVKKIVKKLTKPGIGSNITGNRRMVQLVEAAHICPQLRGFYHQWKRFEKRLGGACVVCPEIFTPKHTHTHRTIWNTSSANFRTQIPIRT